jgi:hypothetical protein
VGVSIFQGYAETITLTRVLNFRSDATRRRVMQGQNNGFARIQSAGPQSLGIWAKVLRSVEDYIGIGLVMDAKRIYDTWQPTLPCQNEAFEENRNKDTK